MIHRAAIRAAIIALMGALVAPGIAISNSRNGNMMTGGWAASDRCAAQAQKQFPDFTAESNAKRDAALKRCLATNNLPPHNNLDH